MSELTPQDLAQRLDDLLKEVRRQGRAAIAAQAAAESCLEAIRAQAEGTGEADAASDDRTPAAVAEEAARWLRALIPVADAVDRVVRQAASLEAPRPRAKGWSLRRLLPLPVPATELQGGALVALNEGLRVLRAQLEGALGDLGVSVDRRTGAPVDGERQRVVEVRSPRFGERPGTVVEVVRPGYALGAHRVREAEVVVAEGELFKRSGGG